MPAKPGLMLRLTTITVVALSTSRMGMPSIELAYSVRAAGARPVSPDTSDFHGHLLVLTESDPSA